MPRDSLSLSPGLQPLLLTQQVVSVSRLLSLPNIRVALDSGLAEATQHLVRPSAVIHGFTAQARAIAEAFERSNRNREHLEPHAATLGSWGWTIPVWGHLDLPALLATEGNQATADEYFIDSYHERDGAIFNSMVRELEQSASLRRWWPLMRQCLGAHQAGEYLIAVPALLTAFEGYLFHGAPVPGVTTRATRLTAEKRTALEPGIERLAWVSLDAFVAELWRQQRFDGDRPSIINRHWILHGRDALTWGEPDSLRLLQAITTLAMLLD